MRLNKNSRRRKEKELRTLKGIRKGGIPKEYQIAFDGMIKRLEWILEAGENDEQYYQSNSREEEQLPT